MALSNLQFPWKSDRNTKTCW